MTPLAAFAEGQLPDTADHDPVRDIVRSDPPLVLLIRIVEQTQLINHLRPGVARQEGEPTDEAPLQTKLAGVIDGPPVITFGSNTGELREGPQELPARRSRAVQSLPGNQALKRVGDDRAQSVDNGLVPYPAGRKVLARDCIENVRVRRDVVATIADVGDLDQPVSRQLPLHA